MRASGKYLLASKIPYRERIYIVKDLMLKLVEYGELNQTALISFCGLNLSKHREILADLDMRGLIAKREELHGKRTVTLYRTTGLGIEFCRAVLEPYEKIFPRARRDLV